MVNYVDEVLKEITPFIAKTKHKPKPNSKPNKPKVFGPDIIGLIKNIDKEDPIFVKKFESSEIGLTERQKDKMEEQTFLNDILRHIDDQKTIDKGVDYRSIINEVRDIKWEFNKLIAYQTFITSNFNSHSLFYWSLMIT